MKLDDSITLSGTRALRNAGTIEVTGIYSISPGANATPAFVNEPTGVLRKTGGNGWNWNVEGSAWLAQHFSEHYAFSGDRAFLEKTAWPWLRAT